MKRNDAKERLIREMLATLVRLGSDPMARVDARIWYDHYRRKSNRMGLHKL